LSEEIEDSRKGVSEARRGKVNLCGRGGSKKKVEGCNSLPTQRSQRGGVGGGGVRRVRNFRSVIGVEGEERVAYRGGARRRDTWGTNNDATKGGKKNLEKGRRCSSTLTPKDR